MTDTDSRRAGRTTRVLLSAAALALAVLAHLDLLDARGREYTEDGFKRTLVVYGISRGLNGVISAVQGTELAFEPAGIGVTLTPGQILDPINDLIERFSWVVLVAGTSLGVQRVLIDVSAAPVLSAALGAALLAAAAALWIRPGAGAPVRILWRIAALALVVRFAVPVMAIASDALYSAFLAPRFEASTRQLEDTAATLRAIDDAGRQAPAAGEDDSLLDSARRAYRSAADSMDVRRRIDAFKAAAADIGEYALNLSVVFVIETLLFPIALLWLLLALLRRVLSWPGPR